MAEVEPQSSISALDKLPGPDIIPGTDTTTPHGEHEVTDTEPPPMIGTSDMPGDGEGNSTTNGTLPITMQSGDGAAVNVTVKDDTAKVVVLSKPEIPKPSASKSNGGPTTPLVKRIINSGTFGAGSVKSATSKPAVTSSSSASKPTTVTASPLKKSASAPSATQSKPAMASSRPTATSIAVPSRRASVVPAKPSAPPMSKPSLSSSTNTKPTSAATISTGTRASVVSPAGPGTSLKSSSAARPRASVSEGVKKAPLTARQSLSTTTKHPGTPAVKTSSAIAAKPTRATSSISSIREVREDGKALEDLQKQLTETTDSLNSKAETVIGLEGQIEKLKFALDKALADAEAKRSSLKGLEGERGVLETKLKEVTEALEKLQVEHSEGSSTLRLMQQELEAAKIATLTQNKLVQTLQAQIQSLESEVVAAKENLEALRASHDSAMSESVAAAAVEHEALIKTQADLSAIAAEAEALKVTHVQALEQTTQKLVVMESKAARAEELQVQLEELEREKTENSTKLSELEIEILELKESEESNEEERAQSLTRVNSLEGALANAVTATQQAVEDAKAKEAELVRQAEDAGKLHKDELRAVADEHAKVVADLDTLKAELADAQASHEQARADAHIAAEDHARMFEKAEKAQLSKQAELMEEIQSLTTKLEGEEAKYNSMIDAVKAEHDKLLQDAFDRAKNEAGVAHSQELQILRADSNASLQQLQTNHQSAMEDLKAEHVAAFESQVNALEKQINNRSLELKATQDDLTKAKVALESVRADAESLTAQLDEAHAAAAAAPDPSPDQTEEIERLSRELSNTRDDLAAANDMLTLTKASLAEVSSNHTTELEEAAKGRAEEVTNLRNAHDEQVTALAAQKSELLLKLSDLEGELATVKASIAAEPPAPKSSGNGAIHPPSPGVTKEELQLMHEAHNLKLHDMQAEHDKAFKALQEDLEASRTKGDELQQDVGRKAMEIQYLEQDHDESQDQITRLKADLETITEQLKAKEELATA